MKSKLAIFLTLAILALVSILCPKVAYGQEETHPADSMWIEPSIVDATGMSVGDKFNVTVWLNVTIEVGAWQFYLTYNKNYLNITGYGLTGTGGAKSQFFEQSGTQTFVPPPASGSHNSTHDYILIGESWLSGPWGTGYGSLAWIEFQITAEPPPTLTLDIATAYPTDTYIMDPQQQKPPLNVHNATVVPELQMLTILLLGLISVFLVIIKIKRKSKK